MPIVDAEQFRHPPAEYRPVAMWFLNGDLAEGELRRQIRAMAEGGVGGIQVAARTGLTTPYLSERWFALVGLILAEARRHGLDVWLADEYPYPSGASGGEVVLRHPEYRAWHLRAARVLAEPGEEVRAIAPGTVLLRACAVPVVGGTARWDAAVDLEPHAGLTQHRQVLFQPSQVYLTTRRYLSNEPRPTLAWRAPADADRWEIWLVAAAEVADYKFFGAYVDLCNPDACQAFLATTYQRYLDRLGAARFGQLAGFFMDEAQPPSWSWRLPDRFRARWGYDLHPVLPALWTDIGPRTAQVRYDYLQALTELFVDSFQRPLAAWCREHGVRLSVETGSTRNLVQRHADVPGIDPGHEKAGVPLDAILARELPSFRANLAFPASLAAQTGRARVLDELFHSVGWSLTLQDMKAMIDRAAARGANLFAFHAFCYTIGGLRKWDAPPSQSWQNPYWPHFPRLAAYAGRAAYALARGRRVAPVALVDPITTLWVHAGSAREPVVGPGPDEIARRVRADWTYLMREFAAVQRPHDTLDPLLLAEATVERGVLRLGEAAYTAVVLPPLTTLERAAWAKLEEFAARGGTVIGCGLLPCEAIEPGSDTEARCAAAFGVAPRQARREYLQEDDPGAAARRIGLSRAGAFAFLRTAGTLAAAGAAGALLDLLDEIAPPDLRVAPAAGAAARRQFLLAQRRAGDEQLYFIANASMEEHACELAFRVADDRPAAITRLDLETGALHPLAAPWRPGAREQRVHLSFPRHGAHLLLAAPATPRAAAPAAPPAPALVALDLDGEWRCVPDADNVLRLDRFRFTVAEGAGGAGDAAAAGAVAAALGQPAVPVVEPKPLINILQDLERAGQAWPARVEVVPRFGAAPLLRLGLPAAAWYAATFDVRERPSRAALCLEDAALQGAWELWLNGQPLAADAFAPHRRWDVGNREAEVAPLLRQGRNELLVRVRVAEPEDGLVDALYLLGDFAVAHDGDGVPALLAPPVHVRWARRHGDGYPYYAGTLHLSKTVHLPAVAAPATARLPDEELMFAGVAELAINGHALGARAWAPYAWTVPAGVLVSGANEVTLSVTNTLGEQLEGRRYDPRRRVMVPAVARAAPRGA